MTLLDKNVLITGGAGFIGSHLCEEVARKRPKRLVVVDNLFLGKKNNLKGALRLYPKLKFYKTSVTDYKKLKEIIRKNNIEVVFNLAVVPLPASLVKPEMAFNVNVDSVLNLCELARKGYYKTLIHCSSSEAYGSAQYVPMDEKHPCNPSTAYAASKLSGDQLCLAYARAYGIDVSVLRPFNNYGPRQNAGSYAGIIPVVIKRALKGKTIDIYGDGRQTRDYIFVQDTASAFIDVYKTRAARNQVINVASGKEISVNELVRAILHIMDAKRAKIRHISPRPGDVRRHCGDVKLARKTFDFKQRIRFEDGLRQTIEWYVGNNRKRKEQK
ncbi:MAG: GDP-mannose 4,6-dehydratase [Candidatus Omnitrophica bacterium]|nr:GDP-mannose 4,6-dehydratase [Candidatus Omnitrophota bacterium]